MNCSSEDLKAYFLGELSSLDKAPVEDHVRACQSCREELERLKLTQTTLLALEDEEVPRRISFVSDKVFEPRWYETIWHSGPAMGFASAVILAAAILTYGFTRSVVAVTPAVDTAQIEQRIEREVGARLDTVVQKAVSDAQARQAAEFAKVLDATEKRFETRRQADLATVQQAAEYYEKQMSRWEIALNDARAGQ
ncbi:MAG TPA: zf-HC2 domain-containing protein [Bryobacteraceae bacterium]|jgi:anti-sigma factor RsiW|nr:zf-HC2 domain-containing protein [Bryobacteraceae bacterium]